MTTKIGWTDKVWNPVTGCTQISSGCARCYAKSYAARLHGAGIAKYANGFNVTCHPDLLGMPSKWTNPCRVFVNSMSDLFHDYVPPSFLLSVFHIMGFFPQHRFQVLTKRAERLLDLNPYLPWYSNIWMGVTVEEDAYSFRTDLLKQTGAKVKFVSVEPLIGPAPSLDVRGLDWVIVGGEKASGARPMHEEWVMPIKEAARISGIPFFFKQWGSKKTPFHSNMFDGDVWHQFPG